MTVTSAPQLARPFSLRLANLSVPARVILLVSLFVAAFGLRMYHVQDPPLAFHATRQYRSLLLAREYYFELSDSVPAWEREVAATSAERQGILEPPILEHVVALAYRVMGGESLWLPKVLSSGFWLAGGGFLYAIARRFARREAAMLATAFYLFLPFAVIASRSFQPDPLMIMLLLGSVLAMVRYWEHGTTGRFVVVSIAAASAVLVKPMAVFPVVAVFLALSLARKGIRATVWSRTTTVFLVTAVLPAVLVYAYGIITGTFLTREAEKTLVPELLLSRFFWTSWAGYVSSVVGFPFVIAALLGTWLVRGRTSRALMFGLWAGYALFCLVVNYNVASHNYYQLQLIPIVALGLAPLADAALGFAESNWRLSTQAAAAGLLLMCVILTTFKAAPQLRAQPFASEPAIATEIGAEVQHSTRTLYLSGDYGVPLEYHGQLSGASWPIASDLEWEWLTGKPQLDAEARFQSWFAKDAPEYFVVMDLHELDEQPDLKQFLTQNFFLIVQKPDYWVFDLRQGPAVHVD
jgi:hypothetical protein